MKHATEQEDDLDADEQLLADCVQYLSGTHTTLWGRSFNIFDPKQRYEAAEWLTKQIKGVMKW